MWPMGHPDTDEVGGHDRDILWAILGYDDFSLPSLRMDNGKSGQFGCNWARFLGLRGAPRVIDVAYGPLGHRFSPVPMSPIWTGGLL